jgi:5-methylthioadenosine/S-adenosylhomocysteine deaminase
MKILIENCALLDADAAFGYAAGTNIVIRDQQIAAVGDTLADDDYDRRIDGRDLLALPGLINAHTHSHENFSKGSSDRLPFEPWLIESIASEGAYDERDYYLSAMIGCIEMLQSGTTSVIDHVGLVGDAGLGHLSAVMQAYKDSGMRALVAPLFREIAAEEVDARQRGFALGDTSAEAAPNQTSTRDRLDLFERFFRRWQNAEGGRLRCSVGPSGVQWLTPDSLHQYFDLAQQFAGGMHVHFMETRVQDQIVRKLYGKTAAAMMMQERLLSPNVSLPHSIWITGKDVERIALSGAVPVHNPAANLRLGSGLSPIRKMLDAGIVPALGSDGAKSSDHQNMFGHLHLAALVHNLTDADPKRWISSRDVVAMITDGGAAAMMLPGRLGRIAPGFLADITLLDLRKPEMTPLTDAFHQLAYCELGRSVHTVIVDGSIVVDDGKITTFDSNAVLAEAREVVKERRLRHQPLTERGRQSVDRYLAYQQHVLSTTTFEQD